jgi:hypothetical protein
MPTPIAAMKPHSRQFKFLPSSIFLHPPKFVWATVENDNPADSELNGDR